MTTTTQPATDALSFDNELMQDVKWMSFSHNGTRIEYNTKLPCDIQIRKSEELLGHPHCVEWYDINDVSMFKEIYKNSDRNMNIANSILSQMRNHLPKHERIQQFLTQYSAQDILDNPQRTFEIDKRQYKLSSITSDGYIAQQNSYLCTYYSAIPKQPMRMRLSLAKEDILRLGHYNVDSGSCFASSSFNQSHKDRLLNFPGAMVGTLWPVKDRLTAGDLIARFIVHINPEYKYIIAGNYYRAARLSDNAFVTLPLTSLIFQMLFDRNNSVVRHCFDKFRTTVGAYIMELLRKTTKYTGPNYYTNCDTIIALDKEEV